MAVDGFSSNAAFESYFLLSRVVLLVIYYTESVFDLSGYSIQKPWLYSNERIRIFLCLHFSVGLF